MRKPGEGRPSRLWILFAALVVALATIAAGCGGGDDEGAAQTGGATTGGQATGEAIKIGVFSNNEGPFARSKARRGAERCFRSSTEVPLLSAVIRRRASTTPSLPAIRSRSCTEGPTRLPTRQSRGSALVEQEKVDILVGPLSGSGRHRGCQLLEGTAWSHVRERDLGRAGHHTEGALAELLPLPQRRYPVDGGASATTPTTSLLAQRRHDRRRLRLPVLADRRLRGGVLLDRRQRVEAALARAR